MMPLEAPTKDEEIGMRKREVQVAERISALVNDEIIKETLDGLLHGAQNEWLTTLDRDQRDQLWLKVQGLTVFIESLRQLIESGRMAAIQLKTLLGDEND